MSETRLVLVRRAELKQLRQIAADLSEDFVKEAQEEAVAWRSGFDLANDFGLREWLQSNQRRA